MNDVTSSAPPAARPDDERQRLAEMFEQAPSFMALLREPSHRIVLANRAFQRLLGRKDLVGLTASEALPPELAQLAVQALDRAYRSGEASHFPAARMPVPQTPELPAGERILDVVLQPITDANGAVAGVFVDGNDITERHLAEQRLQGALAIKTVGIIYWGANFGLTQVNDAFLNMSGFSREEALGKTWQELTPPEFWSDSERAVEQVNTVGEAIPYEKQYFGKNGRRWWGLFAPRRVSQDEVVEFVLDITERKEAEAELRRLNETLERRVMDEVSGRMQTEAALRQSQKLEAIGQLTGGVAHDFNNLLTVIRGSAEMLRRPDIPPERRARYVEAIAETAERAAKLTSQLLAFSRRQALRPVVFSVGHRVDAIRDMLATVVGSRIVLTTKTDCEVCYVEADPTQFDTAIVNMAVNARDAMDGAGELTIAVAPATSVPRVRGHRAAHGDFVEITVTDTGVGIPPEQLAQIFEPFFTTKEVGKGTGLGLSQVYGFAKQSGGEISAESQPGAGATFRMYLPRVAAAQEAAQEEGHESDGGLGRGHVLVVEDNEQVGAFSSQLLAELGFETTWAANAAAALRLLEENKGRYAAVFSDVVMPGMNGVDLGREIARREPGLPVILTSGYSHVLAQEGRHGFELLQKPYSIDDLTRVLRRAIGRVSSPPTEAER
ncbi:hybrid sensor histidine kinase/response regulator [Phenylobacterium deserti]|uniref:histidine kinase n=1 Tax=Phenylobacterium deserti TaxID=1914756 RepID=A0A328AQ53_9CAUL|nr:PAS domain-containing sensor histidine kinase [Phenylobacterium deserti]RAK56485.1 hybrid sensor histidine kinase/response regulator [Phenylobacterium deserti]